MNKIFKKLIVLVIIVCTISTITFGGNSTNPNGKGNVTGGKGTEDNPYKLKMGDSVIDIYYGDLEEVYFEFTNGNVNAGNYMVDNNQDLKRLRFTLIGTDEISRRVTPQIGLKYIQAGGITYVPEDEQINQEEYDNGGLEGMIRDGADLNISNIQKPLYNIQAIESFKANRKDVYIDNGQVIAEDVYDITRNINLGNGYLTVVNNTLMGNASNYATSYIFAKSKINYNNAYKLGTQQLEKIDKLNINMASGLTGVKFVDKNVDTFKVYKGYEGRGQSGLGKEVETLYDCSTSVVRSVYVFKGLNTKTLMEEDNAGSLEWMISKIFVSIGDVFIKLCGLGGSGGDAYVTIDSLIFNEYPNTIVDFFGNTGYTNAKAKDIIGFWYKAFQIWTLMIYTVLLVYVGLRAVIVAGTSEQSKVKVMFEGWLQGLLLLFLLPFFFKYLIQINDFLVDILRTNSKYSIYAYYSFEKYYADQQEDGENSTTTVLERLENSKAFLMQKIEALEKNKENEKEYLEKAAEVLKNLESEKNTENYSVKSIEFSIKFTKDGLNKYLLDNNLSILKEGKELNTDILDEELTKLVIDYYSIEENREKFIENKNIIQAIINNQEFNNVINQYIEKCQILSKTSNNIINDNNIKNKIATSIDALAKNILPRECYDIFYESMKKDFEEIEQEIANTDNEISNIDQAIEMAENNDADLMGHLRIEADRTGKFLYVIVWFIMLFEVVVLLFLYYKRLFMLMVLVTIFPLVTLAYAYEKARGKEATILKTWMQEYVLNVFIQTIHAILYIILVETGYTIYIADNGNWLIFILAVVCLIMVEPVFKNLLGLKGSTVADLTKYGSAGLKAAAAGVAIGSTIAKTPSDLKKINTESKNKEQAIKAKHEKKDTRTDIKHLERDNRINQNTNLTDEQKKAKLDKAHSRDERSKQRKEWVRKQAAKKRKFDTVAKMAGRVTANATALYGSVAASLAAGGDVEDFTKSASVANAITGTGGSASLSPEAQKEEAERLNMKNQIGDINTEAATNNRTPNYSGAGYNDYANSYNRSANGNNGASGNGHSSRVNNLENTENTANTPKANKSKLANTVKNRLGIQDQRTKTANRLDQQKIFVNENFNIHEENKND